MGITLRLTGQQHQKLRGHLMPTDGNEAIALLFCVHVDRPDAGILLVKEVRLIPYKECILRTPVQVIWPTETYLLPEIERIEMEKISVIAIHSHPNGYPSFSGMDDAADAKILGSLYNCVDSDAPHGSAIMFPGGSIKARVMNRDGSFKPVQRVLVAGDRISLFDEAGPNFYLTEYQKKTEQVLGKGTLRLIRSLRIGVVGCSGTGSPVIELLMRHSVGELVLVDFDIIKGGNLNRMIMSRLKDADEKKPKVERYKEWADEAGLETCIIAIQKNVEDDEAIEALSSCDIIFGCVDNVEARHFLNKVCTAYLIPLFDVGVGITLDTKNLGGISHALSRAHYVQPDKAGLLDREAFTGDALVAEDYKRTNPEYYKEQVNAGYLDRVGEDQPAVMSLTMDAALLGVQDMLARLQGFRLDEDKEFEMQERSITHGYYRHSAQPGENKALKRFFAFGDKMRKFFK
jgi:hypothetical protein